MLNKISGSFVRRAGGSSWPAWSGLPANTRPHHSPNTALRCLQPWWLQTIQINSPHRSPPRLHFPKLTKSAKPAAISTLTTLSFPKTYKCLEWARTNPFSKTYKSWHCGEEQVGGGYSNATSHGQWPAPTILCAHWASVGQSGTKFYPLLSSWCSTIVTECLALSQHDVLAGRNVSRLLLTWHWRKENARIGKTRAPLIQK